MAQYQILYWRDIPAQVKVYEGRRPISEQLPPRFQLAIDRIAMAEGLTGSDAYLDQWQWSPKQEREGAAKDLLQALVEELVHSCDHLVRSPRRRDRS